MTRLIIYVFFGVAAIFSIAVIWMAPPGSFDPFCTYESQYKLTASLRVGPELLQSTVRTQNGRSRAWVETINYAGCQSSHGKALSFVSSDGRVFLIPTLICPLAQDVLLDVGKVDVLRICRDRWPNQAMGFIVSTASQPRSWQQFNFSKNGEASLEAMDATSYSWGSPTDELDSIVPTFRNTYFDEGNSWWYSPNRILRRPTQIIYRAQKL